MPHGLELGQRMIVRGAALDMPDCLLDHEPCKRDPAHASEQERAAAIEYTAGLSTKELAADVAASAMALRVISRQLPDDAWRFPVRLRDSGPFPAAGLLTRRLVEVELHHCDLGAGYAPGDWPVTFAAMELAEPMRSLREDRLRRAQQASSPAD